MNIKLTTLLLATLPITALGQMQEVYSIDRPLSVTHGWGQTMNAVPDLDADGVGDLLVGIHGHGGGVIAAAYSGATGAELFFLNAPLEALFYGSALTSIADVTGDGVADLLAVGAQSGDAQSFGGRFLIYSGADGSVVQSTVAQAGVSLNYLSPTFAMGDLDGDGHEEVLCMASAFGGTSWTMFSPRTGVALYSTAGPASFSTLSPPALLSDHDADGIDDFAVTLRVAGEARVHIYSTALGLELSSYPTAGSSFLTSNGEPFLSVADLDGDGLRDMASGAVFSSFTGLFSSLSGATLQSWDCLSGGTCFGSRLIEVEDFTGDGHPDLIALESEAFGAQSGLMLVGLDPAAGEIVFEQHDSTLNGGYSSIDRITAMPGADPLGFSTFAVFEETLGRIAVRRISPAVGTQSCASTPNSTGVAASLQVHGNASVQSGTLSLSLQGAPAGESVYFLTGTAEVQLPLAAGVLCTGGSVGRLPAGSTNASGGALMQLNVADLGMQSRSSIVFQAIFRDSAGAGLQTSDAVTVELLP